MADAPRRADAVWQGSLGQGSGVVSLVTSGAAGPLPVTWASRTERSNGKTSPEELVAAAHASCYCMALSNVLGEAGTPPEKLETSVTVTFTGDRGRLEGRHLADHREGHGTGHRRAAFKEAAAAARDGCPISGALKGNVEI